jgi:Ribonuclease G/E
VIVTPGAPGVNVSRSIRDDARDALLAIAHAEAGGLPEEARIGLILRSACEGAAEEDIAEDIRAMLDLCEAVLADAEGAAEMLSEGDGPHVSAWRDWSEPAEVVTEAGSFGSHGVLDALEMAEGAEVALGGGAYMYVEPTRALVAVDVNTGRDTSPAAGTKANFAVAKALPRALRVRGLGGQIVLDLAPMPKKDRRGFESALRAAFKRDHIETTLVGWTPLGHYELQRKNARAPLSEVLK